MKTLARLRAKGWMVAVHNDYHLNGERMTFWLLSRGNVCVKGEGRTDEEALAIASNEILRLAIEDMPGGNMSACTCGTRRMLQHNTGCPLRKG